jgi:hypothetical protein
VLALDESEVDAAAHGRALEARGIDGAALLVDAAGAPVAVARERDGQLRTEVGLRG